MIVNLPDTDVGVLPMHNVVPRLTGTPRKMRMPAPEHGQHIAELGAA